MENMELNLGEMEAVTGGERHFEPKPDKKGFIQYKVVAGDTLIRIAAKFNIKNWKDILDWNPHIDTKTYMIRVGEYLWIKQ